MTIRIPDKILRTPRDGMRRARFFRLSSEEFPLVEVRVMPVQAGCFVNMPAALRKVLSR